ncbi:hypothetical protein ADS46_10915 [Halomonas sp. G11]|nr:hypothetical protein ADS46_10915 [Halomonas sp. G11]
MDFVFDRRGGGRVIKSFTVVNGTIHEAVAIVVEHAIGGLFLIIWLYSVAYLAPFVRIIERNSMGASFCHGLIYMVVHCF